MLGHLAHEQAVKRPAEGGSQRKQVAFRGELQPGSVEDYHRHAGQRQHGSENERKSHPDILQPIGKAPMEESFIGQCQQRREQRGDADQERDVRSLGMGQGRILRQEIERPAGNAQEHEDPFVLPAVAPQFYRLFLRKGKHPDARIRQHEADDENRGRMHPRADERLRTDEGDAPDGHDDKGQQMEEKAVFRHGFLFHFLAFTGVVRAPLGILREPAFEDTLFLGDDLVDAPEE